MNDNYSDANESELDQVLDSREPPFNYPGDFCVAAYDATTDRFIPAIYDWVAPDHVARPLDAPAFVTESEALGWLRDITFFSVRRDPKAPNPRYETSFVVHLNHLDRALMKCAELGLEPSVGPVHHDRVLAAWGCHRESMSTEAWKRIVERAKLAAADYSWVHVRATPSTYQVVAVARQELGMPVFHTLEGHEEAYWTPERISSVDFARCDQCGARHHRTKLFLVRNNDDGQIYQYGGSCARHLNLAKMVDDHLRALKALQAFLAEGGDGENEWGFGGGSKNDRVDPQYALAVADMIIGEHGYVSGKVAWASQGEIESTKSRVSEALGLLLGWIRINARDHQARAERDRLQQKMKEYPEERSQELYQRAEAMVEEKFKTELSEFTNNLRVAFRTGSLKLLGFLVWIPSALRREDAKKVQKKLSAEHHPWTPGPNERPTTGEELRTYIDHWHGGSLSAFCSITGMTETQIERTLAKPDAALPKGLLKKIDRLVPGAWTVVHARSSETDFGTVHRLDLVREDGAKITWKCAYPGTDDGFEAREGDVLQVRGATIGDIPKPYTSPRTGKTWQDGRSINRVSCTRIKSAEHTEGEE